VRRLKYAGKNFTDQFAVQCLNCGVGGGVCYSGEPHCGGALKSYLEGPIIASMKEKKAFSDINLKTFEVVEEATALTRGPI